MNPGDPQDPVGSEGDPATIMHPVTRDPVDQNAVQVQRFAIVQITGDPVEKATCPLLGVHHINVGYLRVFGVFCQSHKAALPCMGNSLYHLVGLFMELSPFNKTDASRAFRYKCPVFRKKYQRPGDIKIICPCFNIVFLWVREERVHHFLWGVPLHW